jgi:hypothetical protein
MNAGLTAVSWLDWKLGVRLLLKYPALTIIGGLSLAGAIAIGAVGIEVADELLYKRLPFPEGSRVVRLETQDTAASRVEPRVLHDFAIWRRSLKTVAELGAARVSERNVLTGEGRVESLRVAEITASAFPLTRVPPLLGRPLQPTDEMQGAEPVVVLGYDVWQRQFLHDPAAFVERQPLVQQFVGHFHADHPDCDGGRQRKAADDRERWMPQQHPPAQLPVEPRDGGHTLGSMPRGPAGVFTRR